MKWLVLRALGLWFALIIITSAVALGVRLDPDSPTLKAVGLSLCQNAPCFHGLKVGSSWDEVQIRFPNLPRRGSYFEPPINVAGIGNASVLLSADGKTVRQIDLVPNDEEKLFPQTRITVGEIILRYEAPCRLKVWTGPPGSVSAVLIYPELIVYVDASTDDSYTGTVKYQIQPISPIVQVSVAHETGLRCDSPLDTITSRWQGFISANLYQSRFRSNRVAP